MRNLLPAKQACAYVEAGSEADQGDEVAVLEFARSGKPVERERDASARDVARLAQGADRASVVYAEPLYRRDENALVRLMKNQVVDVRDGYSGLCSQPLDRVANRGDGEAEHAAAVHG